jgi:hypothetical protein
MNQKEIIVWLVTSFISSFIFVLYLQFPYIEFDLVSIFIIWGMFVLPVFLIGSYIALNVDKYVQLHFKSPSYLQSLLVFISFGFICNVFAFIEIIQWGWNDVFLEYLIFGILGSLLYFHIWLLFKRLIVRNKTKNLSETSMK